MSPFELMQTTSVAVAGFAAVSAVILFFAYVALLDVPFKSAFSTTSCAALLTALAVIEASHLRYFQGGREPLESIVYCLALFIAPPTFYFFGRWVIFPSQPFRPALLAQLLPLLSLFVVPLKIALPILLLCGAGNSIWLGYLIYGLREQRKQFRFEFLYFGVMSVLAVIVLALGLALPYVDHIYFYVFYNFAVGLGFAIMLVALVTNPDLIGDLSEAARVKYGSSTLGGVDIDAHLKKLGQLMAEPRVYQNENLSLASLAKEADLSGHQLSELINSRLGMGFAKYVRECRVRAAEALLISAPAQSILSISMDTGFRSQSAFYAAFREINGQSPGDYRKSTAAARSDTHRTPE
jgi:AraC-like DNA-binding protein